ncbi:MAG: ABC-F family ATP-binding cassette domain-containing protein [Calditrichia bacterium]
MIQLQDIRLRVGSKELYHNLNLTIREGVKYAFLGANGIGKTSLFRLILGELEPEEGQLFIPSHHRIGYLPQDILIFEDVSVREFARGAFGYYFEQKDRITRLEEKLQQVSDDKEMQILLDKLQTLYDQQQLFNENQFEGEIERVLKGLGFRENEMDLPLQSFSGGWQMRAYLATLLLSKPDFLLLDEPTNHLDIDSLRWLEQFLISFKGSVVFITHDRLLVDRLADKILYADQGDVREFSAPYEQFEQELLQQYELKLAQYENQQRKIKDVQRFIERFRYKASKARQVQSRLKELEKMEKIELNEMSQRQIQLAFTFSESSYKDVFHIEKIWFRYDSEWIISDVSMDIFRGEKIGVIGPNGAGKTTLLKLLTGLLRSQRGNITVGERVHVGYYAQHQIEQLNLSNTILEEVVGVASTENIPHVRNLLGAFLFHDEDQEKKIEVLSGGEKARVALAKLLVQPYNTLILDEPTNHLDMISREVLADAINRFEGTVILVSHDRQFLDRVVNRTVYISNKHDVIEYPGNYSGFYEKYRTLFEEKIPDSPRDKTTVEKEKNNEYENRKQLKRRLEKAERELTRVESEMENLQGRVKEIEFKLSNSENLSREELLELSSRYQKLKTENELLDEKWLLLQDEMESLQHELNKI